LLDSFLQLTCFFWSAADSHKSSQIKVKCHTHADVDEDATTKVHDTIKWTIEAASNSKRQRDLISSSSGDDDEKSVGLAVLVEYEQKVEQDESGDEVPAERRALYETETKTSYKVVYDKVIEYAKPAMSNNDGRRLSPAEQAYDWDQDEIVQTIDFSDYFGRFSEVETQGDQSDFSIASSDSMVRFDFHLSRTTPSLSSSSSSSRATANKLKMDVVIQNFPWQSSDTYLALITHVESKQRVKVEYKKDDKDSVDSGDAVSFGENGVARDQPPRERLGPAEVTVAFGDDIETTDEFASIVPFGEYTWAEEALVFEAQSNGSNSTNSTTTDGTNTTTIEDAGTEAGSFFEDTTANDTDTNETAAVKTKTIIQVIATSPPESSRRRRTQDRDENMVAFSFVGDGAKNAEYILWDPEVGIGYADASSAMAASLRIGAVVGALFFVLLG